MTRRRFDASDITLRMTLRYNVLVQQDDLFALLRAMRKFSAIDFVAQALHCTGVVEPMLHLNQLSKHLII